MASKDKASVATNEPVDAPKPISEQALATVAMPKGMSIDGFDFEVVEQLTRTVLSQEDDKPYAVKITSRIDVAPSESTGRRARKPKVLKDKDGNPLPPDQQPKEEEKQAPPMIADVTNLITGELQTLVINASLQDTLEAKFPDESYVGKCFAFKSKLMKSSDKQRSFRLYNLFQIKEPEKIGEKLAPQEKLS